MNKILFNKLYFIVFIILCKCTNLHVKNNIHQNSNQKTERVKEKINITKLNKNKIKYNYNLNNNIKKPNSFNLKSTLGSLLLKGIIFSTLIYNTKADNELYLKTFDNIYGDIWSYSLIEDSQDTVYVSGPDPYTEKPYLSNYYLNGTKIKTKILDKLPDNFSFSEFKDLMFSDNNTIWSIGTIFESGDDFGKHDILISSFDKNTFIPEKTILYSTKGLDLIQGVNNSTLSGSIIGQFSTSSDILIINLLKDFEENSQYTYGDIRSENLKSMFYKNQKYYLEGSTNNFSESYNIYYLQLDQYGNIIFFNTYKFNNTNYRACGVFVNNNKESLLIGSVGGNYPGAILIKLDTQNNLNYALKIHDPYMNIRSGDGVVDIEIDNKIHYLCINF